MKGNHVYARSDSFPITTTFTDQSHTSATATNAATVTDPVLTAPLGVQVKGSVNRALLNVPLATFVDPNPLSKATSIATSIDWGDGTTSHGAVTAVGSLENGVLFAVSGTHTYSAASSSAPFKITTKVVKIANSSSSLTIATTATISQPRLSVSVFPAFAVAGNPAYLPPNSIMAVFSNTRVPQSPSSYKATITWGDGRQTQSARVISLGGGAYAVIGGHTYASRGIFAIRVSVQAVDSRTQGSGTGYGLNLVTVNASAASAIRASLRAQRRQARHRPR